jgi:hypothetical protein
MSKATIYNIKTAGYGAIEESYVDVGSSNFILGYEKRGFYGSSVEIWTGTGKTGVQLTENTDYTLQTKDLFYSARIGSDIYTEINVSNATYQTGTIYITYNPIGTYVDKAVHDKTYYVYNTTSWQNAIEQVSAGNYKIKDEITSMEMTGDTYSISDVFVSGDTSCILQTNNCKKITCDGTIIDYDSYEGYLNIDTTGGLVTGLTITGDNSTSLTSNYTFFCSANYVTVQNCVATQRKGSPSGFFSTGGSREKNRFIDCRTHSMGSDGFYLCRNVSECISESNGANGFNSCNYLSNCYSTGNTNYGFNNCYYIDPSCYSSGNTAGGFNDSAYGITNENNTFGCAENGQPVFMKQFTITMPGSTVGQVAHGISNAVNNPSGGGTGRIRRLQQRTNIGGFVTMCLSGAGLVAASQVGSLSYDATYIKLTTAAASSATYYITVEYS